MERLVTEFVKLWVVIDPIGTLPIFLAVTAGMSAAAARRVAVRGILVATVVLMFFVVGGQVLLGAMDIEMSSFQVAGNIVLFLFALSMIFGESKLEEDEKLLRTTDLERAVYPLAIPGIANPGAMLERDDWIWKRHVIPDKRRSRADQGSIIGSSVLRWIPVSTFGRPG